MFIAIELLGAGPAGESPFVSSINIPSLRHGRTHPLPRGATDFIDCLSNVAGTLQTPAQTQSAICRRCSRICRLTKTK